MHFDLTKKDYKEILENIIEKYPLEKKKKLNSEEWESEKKFATKNGFKVRSKIEKIIADLYFDWGVEFEYEKIIKFPKMGEPDKSYKIYCDFYLPEQDIWHEHFGMDNRKYLKIADIKKSAFKRFKMKFIYTTFEDEADIEKAILNKLKEIGVDVK